MRFKRKKTGEIVDLGKGNSFNCLQVNIYTFTAYDNF